MVIKMKEKLNVCLLNDSFPPVIDGVANAVANYAQIIQDNYGNAVVATPMYPGAEDHYSYEVVRYPSLNIAPNIGYRAGYPLAPEIIRELEEKNFDIIHCHCPIASAILARILRETVEAPMIFTYHTKFDVAIKESVEGKLLQDLAIKWLVQNIEACDDVWVVSEGAGENLRSLGYKGDYIVMRNGADFPKGSVDEAQKEELRAKHQLTKDMPTFLFVGRMMWYKGIKLSLDGLRRAKDDGYQFRMLFVGNGLEYEEIKAYVKELDLEQECIFVGAVQDRELLRGYFSISDLFLFPSTFDTNGIVVTEAAACQTASVVLGGSCAAEGIVHEHNGFVIQEKIEEMAAVIEWVCDHPEEIKTIGYNAMEEVYLSWEDAIGIANKRYQYVRENFKKGTLKHKEIWNDEVYTLLAEAYEKRQKVQDLRTEMSEHGAHLKEELKDELKLQTEKIKEKVHKITE